MRVYQDSAIVKDALLYAALAGDTPKFLTLNDILKN